MTKTKAVILCIVSALLASVAVAFADYSYTQGSGTTVFAFTCFVSKVCPALAPVDSSGAALSTTPGSTAPWSALAVGGTYNSSPPSPSSGQLEPLQLDSAGRLIVAALPAGTNVIGSTSNDPCA